MTSSFTSHSDSLKEQTLNPHSLAYYSKSPALTFKVFVTDKTARLSQLSLPHGIVDAPVFMPVGTQASIKGLISLSSSVQIILSNTYHLGLHPGTKIIQHLHGIHKFMNWTANMLTDSGGFQMVSLLKLSQVTEEGVTFKSPKDGSPMLLTPEKSIQMQNEIGADIIMALDDVVCATADNKQRFKEACYRTIRWLDRGISAHKNPKTQNLFGIVQGGLDLQLRDYCLKEMIKRDKDLPGYAIGGLSGGEAKDIFWRIVFHCCKKLPANKPRYVMGIGYPLDLLICVALGADMFDCVYPCRTARFGTALYVENGSFELHLKKNIFQYDFRVIDDSCDCNTCKYGKGYSRACLHHLIGRESTIIAQLITAHNVQYLSNFMKKIRISIAEQKFEQFVKQFMCDMFGEDVMNYPKWTVDALEAVGIVW